jgi:hypothetical protein
MSGPPTIDLPEKPVPGSYRKAVLMLSSTMRRRLAAATILLAAGLGGQAAMATSAFADVRDQVVRDQSNGFTNILVPDRSAPGSPIRSVQRIGVIDGPPRSAGSTDGPILRQSGAGAATSFGWAERLSSTNGG